MFSLERREGPQIHLPIFLDMKKGDLVIGQILAVPISLNSYQVHLTDVMKMERGYTSQFARQAILKGFRDIPELHHIYALLPKHNRLAIKVAKDCGMSYEGILRKSFLYGGKMEDSLIYSITREDI